MNIVIIEDEILTAEELAEVIGSFGKEFVVAATLYSVKEAIAYFTQHPVTDLVFSDIQLGDGLSFEIFKTVKIATPIIFCTAYDEYAMDAIRSNGIEYILKPFTEETIKTAVDKFVTLKKHFTPQQPDYEKLIEAITGKKTPVKRPSSILIYQRDKIMAVGLDTIAVFYIDGALTRVHCFNGKVYTVQQSLEDLEQLSHGAFFRVNRQYLVNRHVVADANHYPPRKYVVNLTIPFKESIVVSKNRTTAFLEWLTVQ